MAIIESELGKTHEIDVGGMALFGLDAVQADIRAEDRGSTVEVIHIELGEHAIMGVNADELPPDSNQ